MGMSGGIAPSSSLTLGEVLRRSTDHLAARGCDSPRTDAEHLLGHALGLRRIELYMHLDRPLNPTELDAARALVARRAAREPLQHILGEWGFRRLTLSVDRRALIPRPETEILVARCLVLLHGLEAPAVLDVGVGSGAIALALADEHPGARVVGLDVSEDALALARENAARTGIDLELIHADLHSGLPAGPWHLVVSNPPYVGRGERDGLPPEVRDHDPEGALFGDGLHDVIAAAALPTLVQGGAVAFECGDGQTAAVADELRTLGYRDVVVTRDLAGRERVVEGRR